MMARETPTRGQFEELVKLHMQGRRFLDRDQETRLLEEGVTRYALTLDQAAGAVRVAAEQDEVATERELSRSAAQLLRTLADSRSRVTREDFRKAAAFYRARAGAGLSQIEAERRVKRLMEQSDLTPRRAGRLVPTRRWYRAIEA
ncbi:hypothetical protein ACQW02_10465 [Humitalea sp. 24SJ18S-53]|uniref:hypothetical protein n=1 Tax=Humitalea sp. 24SJ18S-53 TaxID=3422307 RepID=UPI003D67A546